MTDTVHTSGRWRRLVAFALFALCIFTALTIASTSKAAIDSPQPPQVWSDKGDYAPGETVTLSGANWAAGESVHIRVNDDVGQTWSRDVDVTAAQDGTFTDQFNLPDLFVANYSVTATGATSGTATWSFTDSNVGNITPPGAVSEGSSGTYSAQISGCNAANPCAYTWSITAGNATISSGASGSVSSTTTVSAVVAFGDGPSTVNVRISATGGTNGNPSTSNLVVTVNNVAPTVIITGDATPDEGATEQYDYTVSDPGGDAFTVGTPSCGTGTLTQNMPAQQRFRCKFLNGPASTSVSITATDDDTPGLTGTGNLGISVQNVNPTVTAPSNQTATQGQSASLALGSFTDPGAEASWSVTVNWGDGSTNDTFTVTGNASSAVCTSACTLGPRSHTYATTGSKTVTVTVNDGTGSAQAQFTVTVSPADSTPPTTTATPSPAANGAGWNNSNVSVNLSATDNAGGSGVKEITYSASGAHTIASTTVSGSSVSGISITAEGTTTLSFFAKDNAGNTEATKTLVVKIDKTAPSVSATPSRPADSNGWYNHSFSVTYSGTDGPSGIDTCSAASSYSGPDTSSGSVSGSCTDKAGNSASASFSFQYDGTAPTVSVTAGRPADHNGWYNHAVSFTAAASSNGPSGAGSCDPAESYSGPDDASASVSMDCTDGAGNTGTGSASFQYDATDPSVTATPSRPADHNGWYNHAFSVSYSGTDDTSDIDECDADDNYSGSDTSSGSVSGSCTDNAGNSGSASYSFKYDATNPTISATLTPAANGNGWNNTDVGVQFTCSDNLSGIDPAYGCPGDQTLTSEGLHTLHVATADDAGNVVTPSFDVRIDKTNPTINGSASPAANSYGWNNTSVTVSFTCADGLSGLDSCESDHVLSSEGAGQSVTGHAKDKAGNQASVTVSGINIDKTKPVVAVTGVSNGGVYTLGSVPAAGCSTSDALSGVKTAATLSSSGGPVGSITASCNGAEDKAGNTNSASVTYTVNYNWRGFFQPVDNLPALNKAKAGSSIPVKFSLSGNQGLSIFASGYPTSAPTTCGSTAAADPIEETVTAGGSSLNYDATADQYVYVWKTNSSWSNSCRTLTVKLVDGTSHQANFYFVK